MRNLVVNHNSTDASEIIKAKLLACGGRVIVHTARGLPCEIWADADALNAKFGSATIVRGSSIQSNINVGKKYQAQMELQHKKEEK